VNAGPLALGATLGATLGAAELGAAELGATLGAADEGATLGAAELGAAVAALGLAVAAVPLHAPKAMAAAARSASGANRLDVRDILSDPPQHGARPARQVAARARIRWCDPPGR
jgi:hypothetical protein